MTSKPQNLTRLMLGLLRLAANVDGVHVTVPDKGAARSLARRGLVEITGRDQGWIDFEITAAGRAEIEGHHPVKAFDPDLLRC
jgi:hypothetical protein